MSGEWPWSSGQGIGQLVALALAERGAVVSPAPPLHTLRDRSGTTALTLIGPDMQMLVPSGANYWPEDRARRIDPVIAPRVG